MRLPRVAKQLEGLLDQAPEWIEKLLAIDPTLIELAAIMRNHLVDNPPLNLSEGGLIHNGVDPILDGLRNQLDDQDAWLATQEAIERQNNGNSNLRLQYHRTFGYFLTVSKARSSNVPDHWLRRQTLCNEERFITPDLKAREGQMFQTKARAAHREYELFCQLHEEVGKQAEAIGKAARALTGIDALGSLAGVPSSEVKRARQVLDQLQDDEHQANKLPTEE